MCCALYFLGVLKFKLSYIKFFIHVYVVIMNVILSTQSMSNSCTKVLFWSSPYACLSEYTSCTLTTGDKYYDFTPLQANSGGKAWRVSSRYSTSLYIHVLVHCCVHERYGGML